MAPRDAPQPYMVYMGPRPVRPVAETLGAEAAARAVEDWRKAHPEFAKATPSGGDRSSLVVAVGGALVAGLTLGIWIGPTLRPVEPGAAPPAAMDVATATPERPALAGGHAPPDRAMIAAQALISGLTPLPGAQLVTHRGKVHAASGKARHIALAAKLKAVVRQDPEPALTDQVGCKPAASRLQVTLCADPTIAAADQDLKRAYQRALKAGAPVRTLRAQQYDWQAASEAAAARSPGELVSAYRQRIEDLNALADDPPH